jgi:hypothetical protein
MPARQQSGQMTIGVPCLLMLVGGGLCYWAYHSWRETEDFLDGAIKTVGTVVRIEKEDENARGKPVVEYLASDGVKHEVLGSGSGQVWDAAQFQEDWDQEIRHHMTVAYRPEAPGEGRIVELSDLHQLPSILAAAGGATVLVGVVLLLVWRRSRSMARLAAGLR